MSISGIGSSSLYQSQISAMRRCPNPEEMFNKLDEDGSSGLSQTEFSALADKIAEATGQEVDVEELFAAYDAEELFAAYDADGDGELSQTETDEAMEANRPKGPPPEMMAAMQPPPPDFSLLFSDSDADESGSLDSSELEGLAEMISGATGSTIDVEELIYNFDEDGDGLLSEEETVAALEANRPEGPPPPPPNEMASNSLGIENYLKMAALETDESSLSALWSGTSA